MTPEVNCVHAEPCGRPRHVRCAVGLGNGMPSHGVCNLVCKLGTRQAYVIHPSEFQSTPEGADRRARTMYAAPTPEQLARMRGQWGIGPGDVVALLVKVFTLGRVKMCETCKGRRRRWNAIGWRGLLRRAFKPPFSTRSRHV